MTDDEDDRLAREAARRLVTGLESDLDEALHAAARTLRSNAAAPRASLRPRVRRHWQGLLMQSAGAEGYAEYRARVWTVAEELMSTLESATDDAPVFLVGRAAQRLIDGPVTLHLRVYTSMPLGAIAEALTAHGYGDPAFETAHTRAGRLDAMTLAEDEFDISIIRCLPAMLPALGQNLFTAERIAVATPAQVRAWARADR